MLQLIHNKGGYVQLIQTLLIAVSAAVLLSGISVVLGSPKKKKANAMRFFLATLGASIWTIAIMIFLALPPNAENVAPLVVIGIISGITLCDVSLLAYLGWEYKTGKLATAIFSLFGIILVAILAINPSVFYTNISLSHEINRAEIVTGWYFVLLIIYFFLISITFSSYLQKRIKAATSRGMKTGLIVFYIGLSIGGILALVFNLLLMSSQPHLIWIGPMATSISILSFFYSAVRYRTVSLSSRGIRILSYTIFVATGAIVYLLVFYAIFTALFKVPNPSPQILILNGLMTIIVLLLIPAMNEVKSFMHALAATETIDLNYILKKLEKSDNKYFNENEVASFLADTMHYSTVSLIIDGRVYSSGNKKPTGNEAAAITKAKPAPGEIWLLPDHLNDEKLVHSHEISRIGILTDKKGHEIGRIVFGRKLHRAELSRRELIKYQTVVGMLSVLIEDRRK